MKAATAATAGAEQQGRRRAPCKLLWGDDLPAARVLVTGRPNAPLPAQPPARHEPEVEGEEGEEGQARAGRGRDMDTR